jgi:hypothetical protein
MRWIFVGTEAQQESHDDLLECDYCRQQALLFAFSIGAGQIRRACSHCLGLMQAGKLAP